MSQSTRDLVEGNSLLDPGEHRLKEDVAAPERLFRRLTEAGGLYRQVGHRGQFIASLAGLGQALLQQADVPAAAAAFAEGLGQAVVLGTDPHLPAPTSASSAASPPPSARPKRLPVSSARSRPFASAGEIEPTPFEHSLEDQALARDREALGSDECERLRSDGAQLKLQDAVSLAHEIARAATDPQHAHVR